MAAPLYPAWTEGSMPLVRQEDENLFMVYPPSKPRPHFLNRTAMLVLESCDGAHSVDALAEELKARYADAPPDAVERDVRRCLHLFQTLGLVHWEEPAPEDTADGVRPADEGDFGPVAAFVARATARPAGEQFDFRYLAVDGDLSQLYSDIALRTRQFHFLEVFFVLRRDGVLRGVGAVRPSSTLGQVMLFTVLLVEPGPDAERDFRALALGIPEQLRGLGMIRIRFSLRANALTDDRRRLLESLGFAFEARLLDEFGAGEHVDLWSRSTAGPAGATD